MEEKFFFFPDLSQNLITPSFGQVLPHNKFLEAMIPNIDETIESLEKCKMGEKVMDEC